jgi:uncharacterized membrane protein
MELPVIKIPEIALPFDIPVLLHPPVDHFIIALPIVVLLLEVINLVTKKRAIGVVSFFLIILTVVAAAAAYFTGVTDGKEAFDLLSQAGQAELKEHKQLGTYLLFASSVVLVFKLLSAMIQRGLMKALFMLILILFVIGILKQGKDGGDLVYKYGANIERVSSLDSDLFDAKEELEELTQKTKKSVAKAADTVKEKVTEAKEVVETKTAEVVKAVEKKVDEVKESVTPTVETATKEVEKKVEEVKEVAAETVEKVESSAKKLSEEVTTPKKVEEAKETVTKAETEKPTTPEVEVVPTQEAPKAEIATH